MKFRNCLYYLGLSCFPISLLGIVNILYAFYFDYLSNINSYLIVIFSSFISGVFFFLLGKRYKNEINIYEQIFLVFSIYFVLSLFILIPFYLGEYNFTFIDSYFESISGLTGTGFTIFENIKYLDPPIVLWRSSSQWVGGLYFLIFLVLVFSNKQLNFKSLDFTFNLEKKN